MNDADMKDSNNERKKPSHEIQRMRQKITHTRARSSIDLCPMIRTNTRVCEKTDETGKHGKKERARKCGEK